MKLTPYIGLILMLLGILWFTTHSVWFIIPILVLVAFASIYVMPMPGARSSRIILRLAQMDEPRMFLLQRRFGLWWVTVDAFSDSAEAFKAFESLAAKKLPVISGTVSVIAESDQLV